MTIGADQFWTPENVRAALGGHWLARPEMMAALRGGASIDTRTLQRGEVFFAIAGERTDGHRFLRQAHEAGAAIAVIDDPNAAEDLPEGLTVVKVTDGRAALGRLAGAYRRALGSTRFVAVTGSNGKTTTARMIHACLAGRLRGRCSPRSFNNDLGVPLTILGARPGDQYVICEVGMNAPGEIEPLSAMIRPDIVAVTSIGRAHLEALGSIEAVAAEKMSLASHLQPGGLVILNADAPGLAPWRTRFERVITFGVSGDADLRVGDVREDARGIVFKLNERTELLLPVIGVHNAINAAAAAAVARRFGLDDEAIKSAFAGFVPAEMRLVRLEIAGVHVINDAYNANPDSMAAALRSLRAVAPPGSRRVAILGDMLEMGALGPAAHRELGTLVAGERAADLVILVGDLAALAADPIVSAGIEAVAVPSLNDRAALEIVGMLRERDTVLLKGSRGMRLEQILDALPSGATPAAT